MFSSFSTFLSVLLKGGAFLLMLNELRGLILVGPVLYSLMRAGGSLLAIWIGVCSLAGIALSVIVPLFAANRLQAMVQRRAQAQKAV